MELVCCFGGWKVLGEGIGVCMLLGFEGLDVDFWGFGLNFWVFFCFFGWGCGWRDCLYFENYIVDVSIL